MIYKGRIFFRYSGTSVGEDKVANEFSEKLFELPLELHDDDGRLSMNFKFVLPEYKINSLFKYRLNCEKGENEFISLFDDFSMGIDSISVLKDNIILLGNFHLIFFLEERVINYKIASIFYENDVQKYFNEIKSYNNIYWDFTMI